MNAEIKQKWVAALRSGEFLQGRGRMKRNDRFCCLGVLCELHRREVGGEWEPDYMTDGPHYLGSLLVPPTPVAKWAGMESNNPTVQDRTLSHWNDRGETFSTIAGLIEMGL